jgi:hypothetical protein
VSPTAVQGPRAPEAPSDTSMFIGCGLLPAT